VHGDAVPANFLASRGEDVVAVDWQCFGVGPVGSDLGYYALSSREELDVLLEAFVAGVGDDADEGSIRVAAQVTAVYSVITRAEWALAQAARGEGALAGKFRHPAVAPYIRALQRQFPQIEALLA
jgi:thiamine kinase-like enzyme